MSSLTGGRFGPGTDPRRTGLAIAHAPLLSALSFPARGKACGETTSRSEKALRSEDRLRSAVSTAAFSGFVGNGGRTCWGKKHGAVHSMGATRLGGLSSWNSTRQGRVSVSAESL